MPKDKDRSIRSLSIDRHRASPYSGITKDAKQYKSESPLGSVDDLKEWDEVRCPICMEHPHNAVLLRCSSHEKGCRPYLCDTSYRHSNCLDQFCKSATSTSSTALQEEASLSTAPFHSTGEPWQPGQTLPFGSQLQLKPLCPLCRGQVFSWVVIEPARQCMNSKTRSCSCETCEFSGTYSELRKHARSEHPHIQPSMVDPTRQHDWRRLERETEYEDARSIVESVFGDETGNDIILNFYFWMAFSIIGDLFATSPIGIPNGQEPRIDRSSRRTSGRHDIETRHAARSSTLQSRVSILRMDRVSERMRGGRHDMETRHAARWSNHQSGESIRTRPAARWSNHRSGESMRGFHIRQRHYRRR